MSIKTVGGKVMDSTLKYKYENVNTKHYGEVKEYKLSKEELEKELKRIYKGRR